MGRSFQSRFDLLQEQFELGHDRLLHQLPSTPCSPSFILTTLCVPLRPSYSLRLTILPADPRVGANKPRSHAPAAPHASG